MVLPPWQDFELTRYSKPSTLSTAVLKLKENPEQLFADEEDPSVPIVLVDKDGKVIEPLHLGWFTKAVLFAAVFMVIVAVAVLVIIPAVRFFLPSTN